MKRFRVRLVLVALAGLAASSAACGQSASAQAVTDYRPLYTKSQVLIPMRDGVRLYTTIYAPRDTLRRHPFLLTRTPYSSGPYAVDSFPGFFRHSWIPCFASYLKAGYIFVYQDVRGRWMSEGLFANARPYIPDKRSSHDVDESSDAYDTVDWLIRHVPGNNGRVGVRGTSYPGFYAAMAAIDAHPAVKVVAPMAPVIEWMGGDDFVHNGAFLVSHAFDFFADFGRPRPAPTSQHAPGFEHGTPDGYEFFLHKLGTLAKANPRFFHDSIAFWDTLAAHPTWDGFWQGRSVRPHLRNLRPAMLWVGGWFDTENLWGSLHGYAAAETQNTGAVNRLVMGPWSHGQWSSSAADSLGPIAWESATGAFYEDSLEAPFFNAYLLDGPAPRAFEAAAFNTGVNAWRFLDRWPPPATARALYLEAGGVLAFTSPNRAGRLFDEYVSDPARPVPYTAASAHWYDRAFMVEDQRFASRRPDVLVYQSPPLQSPLTVAGPIDVAFHVATSGTDCDWIVKVIDVFPDSGTGTTGATARARNIMGGYQMLIRGDVMRGKFRESMSRPTPFEPNAVTPLRFRLNDVFHTFRPGHRIMVQVQSTWFPLIDRNPGRFMDIWRANEEDFVATKQRVFRSATYPSHIVLPVLADVPGRRQSSAAAP